MEKSYLYRRHNVYWVRVRVPDKVRDIVGKAQFSKNLSTTDLSEANRKKHIVVRSMYLPRCFLRWRRQSDTLQVKSTFLCPT